MKAISTRAFLFILLVFLINNSSSTVIQQKPNSSKKQIGSFCTPKTTRRQIPKEITYSITGRTPHDTRSFTQGLVYGHNYLYESTGGLGLSEIRKLELNTGKVLIKRKLSKHYFAEGLSFLNGNLVQLTLKKNQAFIYDTGSLDIIDQFKYSGDGWGLTALNDNFFISDGSAQLRKYRIEKSQLLEKVTVTFNGSELTGINEMDTIYAHIVANIFPTDCIAIIDSSNYQVIAWINLSNLYPVDSRPHSSAVLNGIAYDPSSKTLFVTGKHWPYIYHLKLDTNPVTFSRSQ